MFSHNLVTYFLSLIRMEIFSWFLSGQIWVFKLSNPQTAINMNRQNVEVEMVSKLFLACVLITIQPMYAVIWKFVFFFYKVDVVSKIWLWSSNKFFLYIFLFFRGRPKLSKKWYKRLKVCWILSFLLDLKLSTQGCHSKLLRLSYNCSKNLA